MQPCFMSRYMYLRNGASFNTLYDHLNGMILPMFMYYQICDFTGIRLYNSDYIAIYSVLEFYAAKWRDIGKALGFSKGEISKIQSDPKIKQTPQSFLGELLTRWLQWAPGDERGSRAFPMKEDLHTALMEINLISVADLFKVAGK